MGTDSFPSAVVEAGPDTGLAVELPQGRHVVGRAEHAVVRLTDRLAEPHHLLLHVEIGGQVAVTQLSGSLAIVTRVAPPPGPATIVEFGATRLVVGRMPRVSAAPPAIPTVCLGSAHPLDDQLRRARLAFRQQQRWLAVHHPRRQVLGYGTERASVDVVDAEGGSLTLSAISFAEQARLDEGLIVTESPVLIDDTRPLLVANDRTGEVAERLTAMGVEVRVVEREDDTDIALGRGRTVLEVGDRWRATLRRPETGQEPIKLHLALPQRRS